MRQDTRCPPGPRRHGACQWCAGQCLRPHSPRPRCAVPDGDGPRLRWQHTTTPYPRPGAGIEPAAGRRPRGVNGPRAIEHNHAFCKVRPVATRSFASVAAPLTRPLGFAEGMVMSCAPPERSREPPPAAARDNVAAQRARGTVPPARHPRPRPPRPAPRALPSRSRPLAGRTSRLHARGRSAGARHAVRNPGLTPLERGLPVPPHILLLQPLARCRARGPISG